MKVNFVSGLRVAVVFVGLCPLAALAQHSAPAMQGMSVTTVGNNPSTEAFKAADDKMMQGMGAARTGDTDRDFVLGMIPHHQGAIDMAKIELQYGHDPMLRRLATGIIKAQEKEIAEMNGWLAKHPAAH